MLIPITFGDAQPGKTQFGSHFCGNWVLVIAFFAREVMSHSLTAFEHARSLMAERIRALELLQARVTAIEVQLKASKGKNKDLPPGTQWLRYGGKTAYFENRSQG